LTRSARFKWLVVATIAGIVFDQLSKLWALLNLSESVNFAFIPRVLGLKLVFNQGISFSWLPGSWGFSTIIGIISMIILLGMVYKLNWSRLDLICLGALVAGILGNLIDRLFRPDHSVIDFIQYLDWVTGNLADIFIVLSTLFLIIRFWTGSIKKRPKE
jgi:signal peptidase II